MLVTIPMSHFCEKARWALDHAGLAFRERGHVPVIHRLQVGAHRATTVPVLLGAGGTLRDSTPILAYADRACPAERSLYPADDDARRAVDELVAGFDARLGPATRRWFYAWAIHEPPEFLRILSPGLSARQQRLLRRARLPIATVLRLYFKLDHDAEADERHAVDAELAAVSEQLADGRRYLVGDHFGAADLTFAALCAPALFPPGYGGGRFEAPAEPAASNAEQVAAWRATPAGQFALRVYREHRLAPA